MTDGETKNMSLFPHSGHLLEPRGVLFKEITPAGCYAGTRLPYFHNCKCLESQAYRDLEAGTVNNAALILALLSSSVLWLGSTNGSILPNIINHSEPVASTKLNFGTFEGRNEK